MKNVIEGYRRFHTESTAAGPDLFERLAEGQSPEALVISCSDSRVSPSLLTRSALGTIFVIRNAGNIVPPFTGEATGEGATIEFAVSYLKVRSIVVMGHSHCGAMKGLMTPGSCAHMPLVEAWLTHAEAAREAILHHSGSLDEAQMLTLAVQENIGLQLDHLRTYPAVRARLRRDELSLHAWFFDIATGVMHARQENGQFAPLLGATGAPVTAGGGGTTAV